MSEESKVDKQTNTDPQKSTLDADKQPTPEVVVKDEPQQTNAKALAGAESSAEQSGIVQRRSRWYTSMAALRYVSSIAKDDEVKVRDSDRATSIFLLIASLLTIISLVFRPLEAHRLPLALVCDLLVGVMLVFYVANRFGIVNTLPPRQALLTWQLMMGASFLGVFVTINVALIVALVVVSTSFDLPPL